jgi:probable lipoprotein NlpC
LFFAISCRATIILYFYEFVIIGLKTGEMKIEETYNSQYFFIGMMLIIFMSSCAGSRNSREEKEDIVVSRARSFVGTPYKFGGTTTLGMDCSGLLMRSFESIDMYIPRTSGEQSKLGKKVTISELKKGDLVFFKTLKKKGRVTHAGLVTDAMKKDRIMFIHASSSRGVIEANLMSDYYRKAFVKARRVKF